MTLSPNPTAMANLDLARESGLDPAAVIVLGGREGQPFLCLCLLALTSGTHKVG